MATENKFMESMKSQGLVDDREIAAVADIRCSNGNSGRGFALLNDRILRIYTMKRYDALGELVETLELQNAKFLKGSSFALNTNLKLEYNGEVYRFSGFTRAKQFIAAIKEACGT